MSGFAKKASVIVIGLGVTLLFASLRFSVGRSSVTAAPQAQVVAPSGGKSGEPVSNEIKDFPQLD